MSRKNGTVNLDMRSKEDIQDQLKPIKNGNITVHAGKETELTMIELLLDIRHLMLQEVYSSRGVEIVFKK